MTIEERLVDALRQADQVQPSPDLFARLERSIEEDQSYRRRRLVVVLAVLAGAGAVAAWLYVGTDRASGGELAIASWRVVVAYLAVAGIILVSLAPHIRRFGRSYIDDVFHLAPETGGRFLLVLDIAYFTAFTGLTMVDADTWELGSNVSLLGSLEKFASDLGVLLVAMGVLHALNIAVLPILGLIYNSIVRVDLRRRAGDAAPPESARAKHVDRNARAFAIGLAVAAAGFALTFLIGPAFSQMLSGLG